MKCAICKGLVEKNFLRKIKGTYVGKKVVCQQKYKDDIIKHV